MKLVNHTPHAITLIKEDGGQIVIPPSGTVARVETTQRRLPSIEVEGEHFPVSNNAHGEITGLPDIQEGQLVIVSSMVLDKNHTRYDLIAPDTGNDSVVRDTNGRIIGVRGFIA